MKSISIMCATLIASTASIYAASEGPSWTSDKLLLQTIAYTIGHDGFTIAIYGNQTLSPNAHPLNNNITKNFGFALMPGKADIPSGHYTESAFIQDIITKPDAMYFHIDKDTTLTTEQEIMSVSEYTYALASARRFLLLCPYEERRKYMSGELENNRDTLTTIAMVAAFLRTRMPESTFVVYDIGRYTDDIIAENMSTNKAMRHAHLPDTSSSPTRRCTHARSISL